MSTLLGIDVGGTFTDVIAYDETEQRVLVDKVSSTPANPEQGVIEAIRKLRDGRGVDTGALGVFAHGSTVATNALLELKLAPTALLVTAGFRDVLEIGTQKRHDMFDLGLVKPAPLIGRELVFEVPERLDREGAVVRALDDSAIDALVEQVRAAGVRAVAVCLLFSFQNGDHEQRLGAALRERLPEVSVALSSDVCPEIKEYPRASTTVIAASLQPLIADYIAALDRGLAEQSVTAPFFVMQSSGGVMSAAEAAVNPHKMILSGPAAGVIAAARLAAVEEYRNQITFDMGGTSTDICLIADGRPRLERESSFDGRPVKVPQVDIHTIGAGGGSLAYVDAGGLLRVGPESAGAQPGPACYGRGGTRPTTTDAQIALGRIDPASFLGGEMTLDVEAARAAIQEHVATPLGLDVDAAAAGILDIADAVMARGVRVVSVNRGYDPRDFALLAYGGAGAMHALSVGRLVDVPRVLVPLHPGAFSAFGLVNAELRHDVVRPVERPLAELTVAAIEERYLPLVAEARERLAALHGLARDVRVHRMARLRYTWQDNAVELTFDDATLDEAGLAALVQRFHVEHDREFGHSNPADAVELVAVGVAALGDLPRPPLEEVAETPGTPEPRATRRVFFRETGWVDAPVYERASLRPGQRASGPAIVEEREATTVVIPGVELSVDRWSNLVLTYLPEAR
ncbi:hydantoinase/oxoprolinase family protein [Conexibacter sp. JD483]|uniref:hydantoinase/oxoprolinase family protein n=1 Tax=unclassified Conexibacter TaxID=2627773 RepID=UPI00271CD66F|nr:MULTISPECIES: hydantoinase/oxoprolinase family protein [unclassified Conexibacter]MDO8185566.1 hydantoinase/oxoprolinase family protein [Conexibacter sp. CPCC 205706]MDO8197247.1 hydantoinase/oxoprolinase family protein [Conexibacter sp. CPCC 205762]MDR9371528.1 hydantoinase/oxoprolinase family protein [Conexibacter sp. JD483]